DSAARNARTAPRSAGNLRRRGEEDPCGDREARSGRARPRGEDHRPRAARRRYGGHLHRLAPDPGADRRDGDPGGRGRGRHLDPLRRAHDARAADPRRAARERRGRRDRRRRRDDSGGRRGRAAEARRRRDLHAGRADLRDRRLPQGRGAGRVSIDVRRAGDGVATVTIDRQDALNALDVETLTQLRDVLNDLEADETVRVVVLTGAGDRAFAARAALKYMRGLALDAAKAWGAVGLETTRLLEAMPH